MTFLLYLLRVITDLYSPVPILCKKEYIPSILKGGRSLKTNLVKKVLRVCVGVTFAVAANISSDFLAQAQAI